MCKVVDSHQPLIIKYTIKTSSLSTEISSHWASIKIKLSLQRVFYYFWQYIFASNFRFQYLEMVCPQQKLLTTAQFSTIVLKRHTAVTCWVSEASNLHSLVLKPILHITQNNIGDGGHNWMRHWIPDDILRHH